VIEKIREKGLWQSAAIGLSIARQAAVAALSKRTQYLFLSPQIDVAGAPQVLLRVLEEFAAHVGQRRIRLVTPRVWPDQLPRLERAAIQIDRTADVLGPRLIKRQLGLRKDDFVLLNSTAVSASYRRYVIGALACGQLRHAVWIIHEDVEQLALVAPDLLDREYQTQLRSLVRTGQLTIFTPSRSTTADYDDLFGVSEVRRLRLRVELPEPYQRPRTVDEYGRVDFLLTGGPRDGRKGHMIALFAFQRFVRSYRDLHPELYRRFSLSLIGIRDDYVSQQCRLLGTSLLGDRVRIFPPLRHEDAIAVAQRCNAVICCSFNEAFPLFVAEAMAMGHVVVRNDVGGADEQLADEVNGFRIDNADVVQFGDTLEQILNVEKTPDTRLHRMGQASQRMIKPYLDASYLPALLEN
jgi:glycosyltransferase involved in cell wall biosynthesis